MRSFLVAIFALVVGFAAQASVPAFLQVTPNLFRGGRPVSASDIQWLKSKGIKKIVNIENDMAAVKKEKQWAAAAGIEFYSIPIGYLAAPQTSDVNKIMALMVDGSRGPVFLHCKHGEDRTGMMIGLYRVEREGVAPQLAYKEMIAKGFHQSLIALDNYFRKRVGLRSR